MLIALHKNARTTPAVRAEIAASNERKALGMKALFLKSVRRELEPAWVADTQRRIRAMGIWPKALPLKNFSTGDDFELTRKNRT